MPFFQTIYFRISYTFIATLLLLSCSQNMLFTSQPEISYPSLAFAAAPTYYIGNAVKITPKVANASDAIFSVSPPLPEGLSLNTQNGEITGVPTGESDPQNYVVTATSLLSSSSTSLSLHVLHPVKALGTSLNIWLDASAEGSVTTDTAGTVPATDGQPISRWSDKSGGGSHFRYSYNTRLPTFKSGAIGGKPAIHFAPFPGGGGTLLCLAPDLSGCTQVAGETRTVIAVFRFLVNTGYYQAVYSTRDVGFNKATQTTLRAGEIGMVDSDMYTHVDSGVNDTFSQWPGNANLLQTDMISAHQSYAATAKVLYLGGELGIWIPFDGYLSEFIVSHGTLAPETITNIVNYLGAKYSIDTSGPGFSASGQ